MLMAHKKTSGGFICGEVKLAITLRILAGGSYLDVSEIFDIDADSCYPILHKVTKEWIVLNDEFKIDIEEYLNDKDAMNATARDFAPVTNNIISKIIGSLDGWLVKIKCPSENDVGTSDDDRICNPGNYHCRKGFYALNVQVIVDKKKRVLWHSIRSIGSAHDATAFKDSNLYQILKKRAEQLAMDQFFFIGDTAYGLKSFLLVPYDNARAGSQEDVYNYYHSRARIVVECAFGEIDMRWGIFWKKLNFNLDNSVTIITAALRLHNFLVNYRESNLDKNDESRQTEKEEFRNYANEVTEFAKYYPEEIVGVFGDNINNEGAGRPSVEEKALRKLGSSMRNNRRNQFKRGGFERVSFCKRNKNNHVVAL